MHNNRNGLSILERSGSPPVFRAVTATRRGPHAAAGRFMYGAVRDGPPSRAASSRQGRVGTSPGGSSATSAQPFSHLSAALNASRNPVEYSSGLSGGGLPRHQRLSITVATRHALWAGEVPRLGIRSWPGPYLSTTLENEATQTDWMGDLRGGLGFDPAACCGRCSAAAGRTGSGYRQVNGRAGVDLGPAAEVRASCGADGVHAVRAVGATAPVHDAGHAGHGDR